MNQLFEAFTTADAQAWKSQLEKDLKGISFDDLKYQNSSGITIAPFYTIEDRSNIAHESFQHSDWTIVAEVIVEDETKANISAIENLKGGASGLRFEVSTAINFEVLLQDIDLNIISVYFFVRKYISQFKPSLNDYLLKAGYSAETLSCYVIEDTISQYANSTIDVLAIDNNSLLHSNSEGKYLAIDTSFYGNTGASSVGQLACTLAHINELLNSLKSNQQIEQLQHIFLTVCVDTAFFEQIAKLRALRQLLACMLKVYSIKPTLHLQVETSSSYCSAYDAYSNLLRNTIAGMAAVLGGCNSLMITAFDKMLQDSGAFAARMSRNQQIIFKEESYLNKVADTAQGSYFIEQLTQQIADKSWKLFQEIEASGGWIKAFENNMIPQMIASESSKLIEAYRSGKRVLIGVNKYINANDTPKIITTTNNKNTRIPVLNIAESLNK